MGYVAVSGGREAIEASIALLDRCRAGSADELSVDAIRGQMGLLIDRVMGEAGLYAPDYAAIALKQCEGCVEEAVFLLRAYRSTLTRNYYTLPADTAGMRLKRRISAAFKDIPGGQMLGATYDYTHRLIRFEVGDEDPAALFEAMRVELEEQEPQPIMACTRVSAALKAEGLITTYPKDDTEPWDVTQKMLEFPAPRSARLQTLARADTGFLSGLSYSILRGFGAVHPTVGELRTGYLELDVAYPGRPGERIFIGEVTVTEVETFSEAEDEDEGSLKLAVGYGAVLGRNENKAIAMAVVDHELDLTGDFPGRDEEFVLMHGDSLEMNGFISHLKLPHYVTFQSKLDAVRKTRRQNDAERL